MLFCERCKIWVKPKEEIVMGENGVWMVIYRCPNCNIIIERQT